MLYIHFNIHFLEYRQRAMSESVEALSQPELLTVRCRPGEYIMCAGAPYLEPLHRICPTAGRHVADLSRSQGL
ncbi:MAG: hypothetical protein NVS2B16_09030 [Chloroflexota bacterium]